MYIYENDVGNVLGTNSPYIKARSFTLEGWPTNISPRFSGFGILSSSGTNLGRYHRLGWLIVLFMVQVVY